MKKILVIEDERLIRHNLKFILEHNNYYYEEAENGLEGLAKIKSFKPDLILCDLMLPLMDGFEILTAIRANSEFIEVPFIFLTARADEKDKRTGMNIGADDYLTKPFAKKDLLEAIEKRLRLAERRNDKRSFEARTNAYNIFYTISSHEYLTPLNTIINFSELLLADVTNHMPKKSAKLLEYIGYSGKQLYRVTRKLFWYIKHLDKKEAPWATSGGNTICLQDFFIKQSELFLLLGYQITVDVAEGASYLKNYKYSDVELMLGEAVENAIKFGLPHSAVQIVVEELAGNITITIANKYSGQIFSTNDIVPARAKHDADNWTGPGLGLFLLKCWSAALNGNLQANGDGQLFTTIIVLPSHL